MRDTDEMTSAILKVEPTSARWADVTVRTKTGEESVIKVRRGSRMTGRPKPAAR
ncbi:hypothetical protein [Aeromicrobium sp. Leaf350]|uniref:hypothetical protein n=1 Tax=Aeromicrobium sp. Leaf350 TaxID=2876565 RepID=UPI001E2C7FCE|nr:hypothetical protein [Aeromicrobium sp. Leaf350]